jgi:hypothetical protein
LFRAISRWSRAIGAGVDVGIPTMTNTAVAPGVVMVAVMMLVAVGKTDAR